MNALALLLCLAFAPAPSPDPTPAPTVAALLGAWALTWGGPCGTATLSPGGGWHCRWAGLDYRGSWSLSGRTLTVIERQEAAGCEPGPWRVHRIELSAPRRGTLPGGQPFALDHLE